MPPGIDFYMPMTEEKQIAPAHPGSSALRRAIRGNIVSFPSQIPVFLKDPPADIQRRIVLLYFVRGWTPADVAARFGIPVNRVWKALNEWSVRALALGYVQVIDPEAFAACCHIEMEPAACEAAEPRLLQPVPSVEQVETTGVPSTPEGSRPGADLLTAIDAAIARCEAWRDEVSVRAATLVRDLNAAAAAAREIQRASQPAESLSTAKQNGAGDVRRGWRVRDEEPVRHAIA